MRLKIFFYYINVILAKGQNNVIERVYGQQEGQRRDQHERFATDVSSSLRRRDRSSSSRGGGSRQLADDKRGSIV